MNRESSIEAKIEPDGILKIIDEKLLKKMNNPMLQVYIWNRVVAEIRVKINTETCF